MFTGLIEKIGRVQSVAERNGGRDLRIETATAFFDLEVDHSIAINGVCHTVTALGADWFEVHSVAETLRKTTTGALTPGRPVNLEGAVTLNTRLGGHLVQGHVDCRGQIISIEPDGDSHLVTVELPDGFERYVIPVGSICIDGISLTAARVEGNRVGVAIIPHTWNNTTIGFAKVGDKVNIEVDMLSKYVEKLLGGRHGDKQKNQAG